MGSGLAQRLAAHHQLFFYDRNSEKSGSLQQAGYGTACQTPQAALEQAELVMLAVKPQNIDEVADLICGQLTATQTIVSLLAGTTIARLSQHFAGRHIIRMMPNLALIYGEGLIGLATEDELSKGDKEKFAHLWEPLGKVYWLPENKMDAFTSLASSGPAFVFAIIESMVDAGISMGFKADEAQGMVQQMIKGSLLLLEQTKKHPGELKWQVASPGGTTIAGLKKLEEQALRGSIINIFLATYERAKQLSS